MDTFEGASRDEATLSLQLELRNNTAVDQKGILERSDPAGNIEFSEEMEIEAGKQRDFLLRITRKLSNW